MPWPCEPTAGIGPQGERSGEVPCDVDSEALHVHVSAVGRPGTSCRRALERVPRANETGAQRPESVGVTRHLDTGHNTDMFGGVVLAHGHGRAFALL